MAMELLAPAGNAAALRAAVQSGADAVYIGGTAFGARQSAENFTADDMKRWTDYCHLYGTDVHVTVNTLIKERELNALTDYVKQLNAALVDAVIVQDLGAANIIKNICPDIALHASTQMSVTTLDEINALEKMGFSRVVLARELSAREIERICKSTSLEIEVFVHGAICQCYSGRCLMSSILGGRSGNRGRCAQPCRLPYELTDREHKTLKSGYLLSPKDMALIDELGTLNDIGVKSLKIEGRLKRAEYVSSVVGVYRKYLDMVYSGDTKNASKEDMRILTDAFSRSGFTDGYFKNTLGSGMMSYASPSGTGDTKFTPEAITRTAENANVRKIPVSVTGTLKHNSPLEITMSDNDGNTVCKTGTLKSEKAVKIPLTEERLKEQVIKLGSTPFECRDIFVTCDEGITIPIKEINEVRRAACDELKESRVKRTAKRTGDYTPPQSIRTRREGLALSVSVRTPEQRRTAEKAGITDIRDFVPFGEFLNVYNSVTANIRSRYGAVTLSPELNLHEIRDLLRNTDAKTEIIAYGRLPLMIMKNCPLDAMGHCQNGKNIYSLRDRKKEEFPLMCEGKGGNCKSVLLNSKPIYMADKAEDLISLGVDCIRLIFTVENSAECGKIIDEYKRALAGEKIENTEVSFTRGHFYRGVK